MKYRIHYESQPGLYRINALDEECNLYRFKSDGTRVTPTDLLFAQMRCKRSRNEYTFYKRFNEKTLFTAPTTMYVSLLSDKNQLSADRDKILSAIEAVTATPVAFLPAEEGMLTNRIEVEINQEDDTHRKLFFCESTQDHPLSLPT